MLPSSLPVFAQLITPGGGDQSKIRGPRLPELLSGRLPRPDGAYVHVPFCFHKCHYCDFYSIVDSQARQGRFVERLLSEIAANTELMDIAGLEAIFVGGGTPTLLSAEHWERLLPALRRLGGPGLAEFTVEANPETVTEELVRALAGGGVNRVSVGCQSFDPRHLKTLERWHEPASVGRAVGLLRSAGIDNVNLDLIFGIPGQTLAEWEDDLQRALELEPWHLSCYDLTYEPNTALTARMRAGQIEPADEALTAAMYEATMDRLAEAGFEHYEISAWARPGRRCAHNLLYWRNANWLALGPSASGHLGGLRWKNVPRLGDYLHDGPWPAVIDVELPDPVRATSETLLMGLRLREGVALERLERLLAADPSAEERRAAIERERTNGRLEVVHNHLRLTRAALLVADEVVSEVI